MPGMRLLTAAMLLVATAAAAHAQGREQATPGSPTGTLSNQGGGESTVGKTQPARPEDDTGAKARDIQKTQQPLSLTDQQREQIRAYFAKRQGHAVDNVSFTLSIGAAVPRQVELHDLPAELADIMQGYRGGQYIRVRDQLVIVDQPSRRVVAIVPGIG